MTLPEIVVFEHRDFGGAEWRTNLGWRNLGDFWNDKISSIIIISGTWQFFEDSDFQPGHNRTFGPGYYSFVGNGNFFPGSNDSISSFTIVSRSPQ
jgi:hypothetical protein